MRNISKIIILSCILATSSFAVTKKNFDFVISVDGDFKAAMNAAANAKPTENNRFYILFPAGKYNIGALTGDANQMTVFPTSNVSFIGTESDSVVIYNKSINEGISISATIQFKAGNIYMQDLSLKNTANYGNEGSYSETGRHDALMTIGDKFIYKNVKLLSTQDTYYTKLGNNKGRSYWEGGEIHGTTDFICGDGDVFFQGVRLLEMRKSAMTAAATTATWGYVFNECTIDALNSSINGNYTLGRSWRDAKTVFLNSKMNAKPTAEGWGNPMNSVPQVFAEYNSKDGSGNTVDLSKRRTTYEKDGNTVKLNPVLSANEAAKYTVSNGLKGTDKWDPAALAKQVDAPIISQNGKLLTWKNNDKALCYVIFIDGKYKSNVTTNSYDISSISIGSKITVRAANSMGGLGAASNTITIKAANITYFNVNIKESIGGNITQSVEGVKAAEGTEVTFTATPIVGWKFESWTDNAQGTSNTWTTTISANISVGAKFTPTDKFTYQAESGILTNAATETRNEGFKGDGYINFNSGEASTNQIPVYVDKAGEYTLVITYASATETRSLSISSGEKTADITFEPTGAWTEYKATETKINLPQGASYITFATLNGADGPNLDQIQLKAEEPTKIYIRQKGNHLQNNIQNLTATLYNINGKIITQNQGASVNMDHIPQGMYILQIKGQGISKQKMIQIK